MRSPPMRDRLIEFLQSREKPLFVDLNVRTPWWRAEDMPHLLQRATWLKLNETELQILADELNCSGQSVEDSATRILNLSEIELLILTLGSAGALAFADGSEPLSVAPEISVKTVDTVGAGDAFAAVTILGLLSDWPLDVVMHRAQEFSSQIVQQRGATAENRDLYDQTLQGWETN